MLNYKFIIRLAIGLILSILVVGSSFASGTVDCYATWQGVPVDMHKRPHTQSGVVNVLDNNDVYPVTDITKAPSELEPEGYYDLWIYLEPQDGTEPGWVRYAEVYVFGSECNKFGI